MAQGLPDFANNYANQSISQHLKKQYQLEYDPESEMAITCGTTEATSTTLMSIINSGDEVIIFEPTYDTYIPALKSDFLFLCL